MKTRTRRRLAPPGALHVLAACAAGLAAPSGADADCNDRTIQIPQGTGTITCTSVATCGEENTFAPLPGCAQAFGSPIPTPGRDLLYTVVMPAGTSLDVIAIPTGNWDVALYALSSSDPAEADVSCIDGVDAAFNGGEEVLRNLLNATASPDTIYLIVDSSSTSSKFGCGLLDLEFRHRLVTAGVGNSCDDPVAVQWTDDTFTVSLSTCGNENTYDLAGGKCLPAFADTLVGRDVVFEVTVEDSTEWMVRADPTTAWDPAIVVSTECVDFEDGCVAAVDRGRVGEPEETPSIPNPAGEGTRTYYVLVDSWLGTANPEGCGSVDVTFSRMPFAGETGESCESPIPLAFSGETLRVSGFTCGNADDLDGAAACATPRGGGFPGRDVVYAVTVDATEWAVSVTPTGEWDVSLSVLSACGSGCVAVADVGDEGVGESLPTLANPTPGATYYVVVDSRLAPGTVGGCGAYELRVAEAGLVPTVTTTWGALKSRFGTE